MKLHKSATIKTIDKTFVNTWHLSFFKNIKTRSPFRQLLIVLATFHLLSPPIQQQSVNICTVNYQILKITYFKLIMHLHTYEYYALKVKNHFSIAKSIHTVSQMRHVPSELKGIFLKIDFSDLTWVLYFQHGFTVFFPFRGAKSYAIFHYIWQM